MLSRLVYPMTFGRRHIISTKDFSKEEIDFILDTAQRTGKILSVAENSRRGLGQRAPLQLVRRPLHLVQLVDDGVGEGALAQIEELSAGWSANEESQECEHGAPFQSRPTLAGFPGFRRATARRAGSRAEQLRQP